MCTIRRMVSSYIITHNKRGEGGRVNECKYVCSWLYTKAMALQMCGWCLYYSIMMISGGPETIISYWNNISKDRRRRGVLFECSGRERERDLVRELNNIIIILSTAAADAFDIILLPRDRRRHENALHICTRSYIMIIV